MRIKSYILSSFLISFGTRNSRIFENSNITLMYTKLNIDNLIIIPLYGKIETPSYFAALTPNCRISLFISNKFEVDSSIKSS